MNYPVFQAVNGMFTFCNDSKELNERTHKIINIINEVPLILSTV